MATVSKGLRALLGQSSDDVPLTVATLVAWLQENADPALPVIISVDCGWAGSELLRSDLRVATTDEVRGFPRGGQRCLIVEAS